MDERTFWERCEGLLTKALGLPPAERSDFIDSIEDPELRAEVKSLLAASKTFSELSVQEVIDRCSYEFLSDSAPRSLILDHFELLRRLGSGGMGDVYLARDRDLGRLVALKLLPAEFSRNADRIKRFRQEARAASALNHPNVVTVYEITELDQRLFIATEYVEGEPLASYLADRRMTLAEIKGVALQITNALAAAHKAGIIHRDIKPENVMLRPDGVIKILDFGLARIRPDVHSDQVHDSDKWSTLTSPGTLLGTPAYMSPEQCRGETGDARSDLWSLGVVLYEMVTRCPAFLRNSTMATLAAVLEHEPPRPSKLNGEVTPKWDAFFLRLLAKDPSSRFSSAEELAEVLQDLPMEAGHRRGNPSSYWRSANARNMLVVLGLVVVLIVLAASWWKQTSTRKQIYTPASYAYTLTVDDAGDERPVIPSDKAGDFMLPAGSRFRFHISSRTSGFFYLLGANSSNTSGPSLVSLFPTPSIRKGQASLAAGQAVSTGWYRFSSQTGTETLYMVWAKNAVAQLSPLIRLMNPEDKGTLRDPQQIEAVEALIETHREQRTSSVVDRLSREVSVQGTGNVLVRPIKIHHS